MGGKLVCRWPKPDYPQDLASELLYLFFYAEAFQDGWYVSYYFQHLFLAYWFEEHITGVRTYNIHMI